MFTTQNTALAAYLQTQGFELIEMTLEQSPVSFTFEACKELQDEVRQWDMGRAAGNICVFFANYRSLIKKIKLYQVEETNVR